MTSVEAPRQVRGGAGLVAVPWWPVGAAVAVAWALLFATAGRYGYHRDELYFRMLPAAWGYVDQPPLTPLLAKLSIAIFGDTPIGIRVPAVLLFGAGVVLAALTTRELGGGRLAQGLVAWACAFAVLPLLSGHLLLTASLDLVLWAAVLLCAARALLRPDPRWWLAVGALVGLATYNKLLIAMLVLSLVAGLLAVGPRSVLRSRHLWVGVGIAALVSVPNLVFQITHDFPQLTMAAALSDNNADDVRSQVLPMQFLLIGPLLAPVWIAGIVALFRRPAWRALRAVAVAYLVAVLLTFVGGGQIYYAFGLQAFLLAAGVVPLAQWLGQARWRSVLVWTLLPLHAISGVLLGTPAVPLSAVGSSPVAAINPTVGDQIGWPEYVRQVAAVYASLSRQDQAKAVIFTGNYGEAGSIDRYGPQYGLPAAYSAQNQLYYLGPPPEDRTVVILWTEGRGPLRHFEDCSVKATMDNGYDVDNEEQGARLAVCRLPAAGWAALWPSLQHYD